jgi:hypothetical protein
MNITTLNYQEDHKEIERLGKKTEIYVLSLDYETLKSPTSALPEGEINLGLPEREGVNLVIN